MTDKKKTTKAASEGFKTSQDFTTVTPAKQNNEDIFMAKVSTVDSTSIRVGQTVTAPASPLNESYKTWNSRASVAATATGNPFGNDALIQFSNPLSLTIERLSSPTSVGSVLTGFTFVTEAELKLQEEIAKLRKEQNEQLKALDTERKKSAEVVAALHRTSKNEASSVEALQKSKEREAAIAEDLKKAQNTAATLLNKEHIHFLLNRIHPDAREILINSIAFQDKFLKRQSCTAFIMSVDIRRSTDLMLKARTPAQFAEFIAKLCIELQAIIISHHGVFDKFTGDGVLAFFPEFYSGEDAGFHVIAAASECHLAFQKHYSQSRSCFDSVPKYVGLGIGVDYGDAHLVQIGDSLTVVGKPVVHACRFGGANAGTTLLNEPAYEVISKGYSSCCTITETEIEVKHQGMFTAYSVQLNGNTFKPSEAAWRQEILPTETAPLQ